MSRREKGQREADLEKLRKFLARPRTMETLTTKFEVDRRTIYRWMGELADLGEPVSRVGVGRPTLYQIAC